jgi:hypothetical protein
MASLDELTAERDRIRTALEPLDCTASAVPSNLESVWIDTDTYPEQEKYSDVTAFDLHDMEESLRRARARLKVLADDLRETADKLEAVADVP